MACNLINGVQPRDCRKTRVARCVRKQKNCKHSFAVCRLGLVLRRERDSNPRYSCPYTAFRVRPDRPLRHLSFVFERANIAIIFEFLPHSEKKVQNYRNYTRIVASQLSERCVELVLQAEKKSLSCPENEHVEFPNYWFRWSDRPVLSAGCNNSGTVFVLRIESSTEQT